MSRLQTSLAAPDRFPSPFATAPHPLAEAAAQRLMRQLNQRDFPFRAALLGPAGGKMFGVLVVRRPGGALGYLKAFSGTLAGEWRVDGFAPPLFEPAARALWWPAEETRLNALTNEIERINHDIRAAAGQRDQRLAQHEDVRQSLARVHSARRARRHGQRAQLENGDKAAKRALDDESSADKAERRALREAQRQANAASLGAITELERQRSLLVDERSTRSSALLERIQAGYRVTSATGEVSSLTNAFSTAPPPGGAGDCAAPKLLEAANRAGLVPLAMAEFWWGAPPKGGGRTQGRYYPACHAKCGPLLPFMLDGVDCEPAPVFGVTPPHVGELDVLFEDSWLAVVNKPAGLLSVPGRRAELRDSVLTRLSLRFPDAQGPLLVHRLDLDTSGLLIMAKDPETFAAIQALFARRRVFKRYEAWLDGSPVGDSGTIDLALRVDLDDRPRQLHDPEHGKPATTRWEVLERVGERTRVALFPLTGRTHQLRVHAAHPLGLNAPITGDRLYGLAGERLLLHAEAISFDHPRTGAFFAARSPPPF